MMKKIFLAIAMFLLALLAFAQADSVTQQSATSAEIATEGISGDTLAIITAESETVTTVASDKDAAPRIVDVDGDNYILDNGQAYRLTDMLDNGWRFPDEDFQGSKQQMIPILAICFIVPCFTILVALAFLLVFFMKRSRARNEIIERAIDANYTLPEAFYSNQSSSAFSDTRLSNNGEFNPDSSERTSPGETHRPARDPKSFSAAVTLLAVGFALILSFGTNGHIHVAFLAGGIPFFLGIGKLIGYYYVPGFSTGSKNRQQYPNNNSHYRNYSNQPYNTPGTTHGQYPGAYPPPYTPEKNNPHH